MRRSARKWPPQTDLYRSQGIYGWAAKLRIAESLYPQAAKQNSAANILFMPFPVMMLLSPPYRSESNISIRMADRAGTRPPRRPMMSVKSIPAASV